MGENKYTMEVHIGKYHAVDFECALCEFKAKSLDELELHMFTCEVYMCETCEIRVKTLKAIKTHIADDRKAKNGNFTHLKMDRADSNEVSENSHWRSVLESDDIKISVIVLEKPKDKTYFVFLG